MVMVKKMRGLGGVIKYSIIIAVANGIIMANDKAYSKKQ